MCVEKNRQRIVNKYYEIIFYEKLLEIANLFDL